MANVLAYYGTELIEKFYDTEPGYAYAQNYSRVNYMQKALLEI